MSAQKTLIVIGAGPKIGMSMARRFGREGYRVGLVARNRERLDTYVTELTALGIEAAGFVADIRDPAQILAAIDGVKERFGGIDILEYSPMISNDDLRPVLQIDVADLMPLLEYYLFGAVAAVRAVIDEMVAKGDGALLFTTGASAVMVYPSHGNVSVAMGALRQYVRMLNTALEHKGVYAGIIHIAKVHDPDEIAQLYYDMVQKRDRVEEVYGVAEIGEAYERLVVRGFGPGFPPGLTTALPEPRDERERRDFLLGLYQARLNASWHPDPAVAIAKADIEASRLGGDITAAFYGVRL